MGTLLPLHGKWHSSHPTFRPTLLWHGHPSQLLLNICSNIPLSFNDAVLLTFLKTLLLIFGRPFIKRFTLCYETVVSPVCPVLSVYNVGVLWPNGWMDQDETWHEGIGLGPGHIVLDGDPAPPPPKGHSPKFLAHICCSQMAGWIKMPLGMEVQASVQATLC